MHSYQEIIEKEGKNPDFYLPVINLLKKSETPLNIRDVAKSLSISYGAAKPRLHKLTKWRITRRLKRGYYCLSSYKFPSRTKLSGSRLFFINGCIRIMGQGNGVWITVYNSKFGKINGGKYCEIEGFVKDKLIIRKSNKFTGNKIYKLVCGSTGISIPRRAISSSVLKNLSTKIIPVKIGLYMDEWNITIEDLFGTESPEDGALAQKLSEIGEVKKPSKFDDLKADILFTYKNIEVPIEITTIRPNMDANFKQYRKNSIKGSQLLMRFYYSIKWNLLKGQSTILVLSSDWSNYTWVKREVEFMKRFNCFVIFTDFKKGWDHKSSLVIKRLVESSRFNKKTRLRS